VEALQSRGGGAGFLVREARREDLPRIIYINRVTLPENYPEWFFEEHLEKWGRAFLVAEVDGEVVGYIMTRVEYGSSVFNPLKLVRKGHIVSLAVLPRYRRRGIGSALLREALRRLREVYSCEEAYLEVRVSNEPAINLYKKYGFQVVRVLHMYYLDGEDGYLMARRLEGDVEEGETATS